MFVNTTHYTGTWAINPSSTELYDISRGFREYAGIRLCEFPHMPLFVPTKTDSAYIFGMILGSMWTKEMWTAARGVNAFPIHYAFGWTGREVVLFKNPIPYISNYSTHRNVVLYRDMLAYILHVMQGNTQLWADTVHKVDSLLMLTEVLPAWGCRCIRTKRREWWFAHPDGRVLHLAWSNQVWVFNTDLRSIRREDNLYV